MVVQAVSHSHPLAFTISACLLTMVTCASGSGQSKGRECVSVCCARMGGEAAVQSAQSTCAMTGPSLHVIRMHGYPNQNVATSQARP